MISGYSVFIAILWFNLAMLAVALLRRNTNYLIKYSTPALMLLLVLGVVRVLLPLDFPFSRVISSYTVLPFIRDSMETDVFPGAGSLQLGWLLLGLWILGAVVVLLKSIFTIKRERKLHSQYTAQDNSRIKSIALSLGSDVRRLRLVVSADVPVPFATGILNPRIYLPNLDLPDSDWEFVLKHELEHLKSHDILIKLFYLLLSAVFWWNPVVHKFNKELDWLLELRCDARVTKNMNEAEKRSYFDSILAVMTQLSPGNQCKAYVVSSALVKQGGVERQYFIEQRFHAVLDREKGVSPAQKLIPVAIVALFLFSYCFIIQPAGYPSESEREGGVFIYPDNSYVKVGGDGSLKLFVDGEFYFILSRDELNNEPFKDLPVFEEGERK
jgi:beta-lactamase regulating signal transducer with metallopeptidase domain